jgi:hypothetical protein
VIADHRLRRGRSVERLRTAGFWLRLFGLALVIVGYFGPWVDHKTAALTVTGFELAEFAKFFPQVQGGTVSITRELFYLPLVTVFILFALLTGRTAVRSARLIVSLFAAALLLVALLPYSIVDGVRQVLTARSPFTLDPQYTGQLALVVAGVVFILLTPLVCRLPRRLQSILVVMLALVGAVPALWQLVLLRPLVVALYSGNEPLGLGWGLVACAAGFVLLLAYGILAAACSLVQPSLNRGF